MKTIDDVEKLKTALVAIIGRPSAGKSTFLNTASGEPVSIVSDIPQTTRNSIRGIVLILLGLCFFSSMFITNDVALLTFVPFSIITLSISNRKDLLGSSSHLVDIIKKV